MKQWIMITCMLAAVFATQMNAQQSEDPSEKDTREPRRVKVGGAGGPIVELGFFKNDEINKTLKSAGMPALSNEPMVLVGGEGYGYIMFLPNLRLGGFGTGGHQRVSMLDAATNVKKDVEYHVSYGGFLVDYTVPVVQHFDISGGFTIGSGSIEVLMSRDDGGFKQWGALWTEFGTNTPTKNVTRTLTGSFVAFNPHLNFEYSLLTWMQLRVGVSYPVFFNASWEVNDKTDIQNVPSNLKPDGVTVTGGVFFGFFN
jgi:hypothetical protein